MITLSPIGIIYMLAFYAAFLATGHAISYRSIKSGTVTKYIGDIAKFLQQFTDDATRDIRKIGGSIAYQITSITKEMKRFEDIPNRREPWTLYLQTKLWDDCKNEPRDSFARSVKNFYGDGLYSGNRRVEWGQKGSNRAGPIQENKKGDPYAFCLLDIVFFRQNGRTTIPHDIAVRNRHLVHFTEKCYRMQKNGYNGEKRKLARNKQFPHLCPVEDWLDIVDRFLRLLGPTVTDRPLAIYKCEKSNMILNICSNDSKKLMQKIVRTTYEITDKAELNKFTNHSLRVGACCILQAEKKSDSFIQNALRWRSDTWKMYCRNLTSVANDLSETISNAHEAALLENLHLS